MLVTWVGLSFPGNILNFWGLDVPYLLLFGVFSFREIGLFGVGSDFELAFVGFLVAAEGPLLVVSAFFAIYGDWFG